MKIRRTALLRLLASPALAVVGLIAAAPAGRAQAFVPDILHVSPVGEVAFKGKGSDARFPEELSIKAGADSRVLRALGSGLRKKMMFKVYEGVLYVAEHVDLGERPHQTLIDGDFVKRVELHFLRSVDGGNIRDAYAEGFARTISADASTSQLEQDKAAFLAYFPDSGVQEGQVIEITWMPGMGLYVVMAGRPCPPIPNPDLARALFAIWFGADPVSEDLKRDMLRLEERR